MITMANPDPSHSIKINEAKCIGCVACMKACPTKAIRVKSRKAAINYERCIDCAECLRVCPHDAVVALTTSPTDLNRFKYKVALPSPVLYSQFGHIVKPYEILSVLEEMDFNQVYDEAVICEMTGIAIQEYLNDHASPRPIISSTCPVVVRLVQRLFPDLCNLIIPIEPPRETAAKNLRKEISEKQNIAPSEIGIVHITPCPAKLVSINRPESRHKSYLDGAISIRDIFSQVIMRLKKPSRRFELQESRPSSGIGINWSITGGESGALKSTNTIAVSGVYDTIRALEDIESGKLKNIEYLECMICPDGCVGGPLTVEHRFIAKSNALKLIRMLGNTQMLDTFLVKKLFAENFFSFETSVQPKPFAALDPDKNLAIKKLKLKDRMVKKLPGTDCGVCGAPDCETFAEDIARDAAKIKDCIFFT
jgi:iron only hydrogenase large subunit-like protein